MLTKRQKQILDFVEKKIKENDYAPSLEEIRKHFKLGSVSTVHEHIEALKSKGYLEKNEHQHRAIQINKREPLVNVPLLGRISAGQPIEAIQEKEFIAVPRNKIARDVNIYALQVVGDSMVDEGINGGDIVLVRQKSTAVNGQKIVALIDNCEVTLKKYYKEQGHIRLQPANKNHEPIIIDGNQSLLIQGIVVEVIESNTGTELFDQTTRQKEEHIGDKLGDFVNEVIEGDCLEVMRGIPSKSVDMVLCDLPYGTTQNQWDSPIPLDRLWEHYRRIVKDDGVVALTGQGLFSAKLIQSNPEMFKYKIVWVKSKPTNFLNAKKQPLRKHEDILVFYKKQPVYSPQMSAGEPYNKGFRKDQLTGSYGDFRTVEVKSNGERYPTDVVYFKTAETEGPVYHPTQKPVELGRYLVRTFTKPGDIVLDNTCGSGSFLVSAVLEDRKFIGIEKNQEVYLFKNERVDYIEVCNRRIKEAKRLLKLI